MDLTMDSSTGLLKENGNVRLVVVDSVAFHFRRDFADMVLRTRLLNGMAQTLLRLAAEHELAVRLFCRASHPAHLPHLPTFARLPVCPTVRVCRHAKVSRVSRPKNMRVCVFGYVHIGSLV